MTAVAESAIVGVSVHHAQNRAWGHFPAISGEPYIPTGSDLCAVKVLFPSDLKVTEAVLQQAWEFRARAWKIMNSDKIYEWAAGFDELLDRWMEQNPELLTGREE